MSKFNSKNEELLFHLPDYVTGKITDENLILRIQSEINSNPEFKNEYDSLKDTFSKIKDLKFSDPPEHYFNNLIPEINDKIANQNVSKGISGFFKLSNLIKYAIPAVSVVLLIFIITFSNKNKKDESMFSRYGDTVGEIMKPDSESSGESADEEADTEIESSDEEELADVDAVNESANADNANIIEFFDENGDSDEDFFYYSDFETLTQVEQNELINTLSQTKF